jgi:hypothetical protein
MARALVVACVAWVAGSIVLMLLQGRFLAHYAAPASIPLGLLAAMGLERGRQMVEIARRGPGRALLPTGALILVTISGIAALRAGQMEADGVAGDHERSVAVAVAVRELATEDESIWVWGNEPQVYLDADRPVATPYSYLYPLVTPSYTTAEMIRETLADLEAERPAVVVDAGSSAPGRPGFQPLLHPRPLATDGRTLDILDPLRTFVANHYRERAVVEGWIVYELIGG